jgi:hypothetical protein
MKWMMTLVCALLLGPAAASAATTRVPVEGFEKKQPLPKVWVVGVPNESASVKVSTDDPAEGKRCLVLNYQFTGKGQYLGVSLPVKIQAPIHALHLQLRGDHSGVGYGVYVIDASGETHKFRDAARMKVDFSGWKKIQVDLDGSHESWDGDKNGKIDYPITQLTFEISTAGKPVKSQLAFDALAVDSEGTVGETLGSTISVLSPDYCAEVLGDTRIGVSAPGFTQLTARSWKQGGRFGAPAPIATVKLDDKGSGSFVFPADQFPHGPVTVTISGDNGRVKDNCYLQLYNKGGVAWNTGLPKAPPAAKGLQLIFADDFDGPLSIGDKAGLRYYDHKPPHGTTDFSTLPFVSNDKPNSPFSQVDSYLRIRASVKANSAGLISSLHNDGSGVKVSLPAYFECRFIGPNAPGSWPAFWIMTDYLSNGQAQDPKTPCDELDIIEAYGGEGPKEPNSFDKYMISPHCWNQGDQGHEIQEQAVKQLTRPTEMHKAGIPSTWYEAFHTYGCLVTDTDTVYYCDNIEVGRHKTLPLCKERPLFFMINLATGGGWPVDLSRYNGDIDMYVDYVRVYGKP